MVFQKGREKTGGRKKGTKDPEIAMKAFELALHYRFGKPMTIVAGPEEHPPIKIDISAIPKHHVKA
jgi:hypothetical protein